MSNNENVSVFTDRYGRVIFGGPNGFNTMTTNSDDEVCFELIYVNCNDLMFHSGPFTVCDAISAAYNLYTGLIGSAYRGSWIG